MFKAGVEATAYYFSTLTDITFMQQFERLSDLNMKLNAEINYKDTNSSKKTHKSFKQKQNHYNLFLTARDILDENFKIIADLEPNYYC